MRFSFAKPYFKSINTPFDIVFFSLASGLLTASTVITNFPYLIISQFTYYFCMYRFMDLKLFVFISGHKPQRHELKNVSLIQEASSSNSAKIVKSENEKSTE